jgi:two-component system CheB/CheR fusion protein
MHEPLLVLDKNFIIKSANKSFYKTFQLTEEETLGKVLFELHDNEWNIPGLKKELANTQKKEKMIEAEIAYKFPVIGERIICFNIQSIKRESGEQLILLALDDITLRKNSAEGLTIQIAEKIKSEVHKNEFISMASHELKTPVTSIKGYTQILQHKFNQEGNTDGVLFLGRMDKQINKLTLLIEDLLDATKVTDGKLKFSEELFDFNLLVKEIAEEMQQTMSSHKININLDATEIVYGDRTRIGQVITNMLSNAIKYSPKADKINVTTTHKKNFLKFCVQDFGIGISKENQLRVFEQFYRVSGLIQDTFAGLGLGLFISSEIIKRTNGTMSVKSEVGQGSSFCFTLPLNKNSE